jgi:hypothetical protein
MPKHPPKWWFKKCVKAQTRKKAKRLRIRDPFKLCGYIWYHHMGAKRRKEVLAIEKKRLAAARRAAARRRLRNRPILDRALDWIRSGSPESKLGLTRRRPRKTSVKICRKYDVSRDRGGKISLKHWRPAHRRGSPESECLSYARHYTNSWKEAFYICLAAKNMGVHPREILKETKAPITPSAPTLRRSANGNRRRR